MNKKIKNLLGWFLVVLLFIIAGTGIFYWIKLPEHAIRTLTEFVTVKSNGNYSLSIKKMEREFFPFILRFSEVDFIPDTSPDTTIHANSVKTLYSFSASVIELTAIDFLKLFKTQTFFCQNIRIVRPVIKLEGEGVLRADSAEFITGLISEIRPIFDIVKIIDIPKISFEEAHFSFYSAAGDSGFISQAAHVALDVLDFYTDSGMIQRETGFFSTSDVLIRMNDLQNDMGDQLHVLTIDTLLYSLKTTEIRAAGFQLLPKSRPANKNLFEVAVQNVYLKSPGITRFALNDSLNIEFLEFKNPKIKFFHNVNPEQLDLENIDNFNLYALVQNQFKTLEVDNFYLRNAQLEIFRQPDSETYQQRFESVDITLKGFALDSVSARNRNKLFHADDLEMQVAGYHLRLADDKHHFRADSMFVSTFSNRIGAKKIHIHPEKENKIKSRTLVTIECEALNIEEIVLRNLYHTRTLTPTKIEIIEPDVELLYHLEMEKQTKQEGSGLLFELVTNYLKGVSANLVYIENGQLNIKNKYQNVLQGYFETKFNFNLTRFTLDSTSIEQTDKFFYATGFDLLFSDYEMRLVDDLHKLELDRISISSINQQVVIENLNLHPAIENITVSDIRRHNRSELYHISVPYIRLGEVDLRNAFFNKKVRIADFSITDPTIHFEHFGSLKSEERMEPTELYQLIFNYLEDIDISRFAVPGGKLTWVNHTRDGRTTSFDNEFSVLLENFRLNEPELTKQRLLFSDNFDLTIRDQEFTLSDSVHVLKGSEITLSSANRSIEVKNALLFPLITSEKYHDLPATYQVAIPEMKIDGFDFREAWYSKSPVIRKLELISPRFQIYLQEGKAKKLDLNAYRIPLPPFLQSLRLNELKISNGQAITYQANGISHRAHASFLFDFFMPQIVLNNHPPEHIKLNSKNIHLTISDFKAPVDELHNLSIDDILFDREEKLIAVSGLKISPFKASSEKNRFTVSAPRLNFSDFDLEKALNYNNFEFSDITIDDPEIMIDIRQEIKEDTLEFLNTLDLYPYVEQLVNRIKVDNLWLRNAGLHFNRLEKELFNNKINIRFTGILIDKDQPPANMLNSKEFEIVTTALSAMSSDELYLFTADSMIYNSARHNVIIKNIGVTPQIDRDAFPLRKGYQTDVTEARIGYIELQDINERRWLQNNTIDAAKLEIGPSEIDIFRNKRFPIDPEQRPTWPQHLLKNLKQSFLFDSITLLPSAIRYSELMGISDQPGFIEFSDLILEGGRLSNLKSEIAKRKNFHANARARLMQHADLEVNFAFDLACPEYTHHVRGRLNAMPLYPFNSMISKTDPLLIEEGWLNHLDFDLIFNNKQAEGILDMDYENLKIAVLDYSNDEVQKAKLASFLANRMITNTRNQKSEELDPVKIDYPNNEKRSILNYWWKSLYSGTKEILGLNP